MPAADTHGARFFSGTWSTQPAHGSSETSRTSFKSGCQLWAAPGGGRTRPRPQPVSLRPVLQRRARARARASPSCEYDNARREVAGGPFQSENELFPAWLRRRYYWIPPYFWNASASIQHPQRRTEVHFKFSAVSADVIPCLLDGGMEMSHSSNNVEAKSPCNRCTSLQVSLWTQLYFSE